MGVVAAGALVLTALGQQSASGAAPIDLFCEGRGDRYEDGARPQVRTAMRIKVAGGSGQALVPDDLLAPDDARGWHELKNLSVTPDQIKGKITFSWIFAPVFTLDRGTGVLTVTGSLANFSGTCRPFDPRTARLPAGRPAPTAPKTVVQPAAGQPKIRSDWARPAVPPTAAPAAKARTPGTFVLARFKGQPNWYPAQVMRAQGNLLTVQYANGTQEALPSALVSDLSWKAGSYVECKAAAGTYVPVTIVEMRPAYAVLVVTNQGKQIATTLRSCRSAAR